MTEERQDYSRAKDTLAYGKSVAMPFAVAVPVATSKRLCTRNKHKFFLIIFQLIENRATSLCYTVLLIFHIVILGEFAFYVNCIFFSSEIRADT